ncbi:IS66 family insertion sequence element accessory protein TnpB [Salmonella enterica]|nr:IS66 family insertion sequence element accessory protein TnpB [Salmonella enterica]EBZ6049859.1 IS66 family insertion sequence hypothetical protein [Salmonella enterica subsp. enterica serovar Texas]EDC2511994.1 IS66 family insertion sequence element accessory protein TnpB [Salmonella enterica]EDQ6090126.1 IS66 family insertion sequence element accessory protein TnpB [Salmonella enterica]EDV0716117.1 IS66 family insertion sequence element accessory protein TnpB [Salmonella enterica subsp. en
MTLDATTVPPEQYAEDPEPLCISCEVTFRHGALRLNGTVSEKLLTLLIHVTNGAKVGLPQLGWSPLR